MTTTPVSILGVAHRVLLPVALLGLLTACGGGGNTSSTELGKTAAVATTASAVPSASESAALQAQGAELNSDDLGDALAQAKALPNDAALVSGQVAPLGAYKSGQVAQKAAAVQLPVYRFYNTRTGSHFFTSSTTERDSVQANLAYMNYEGQAFLAAGEPSAGLKPVYRFFNTQSGLHFYTISESERTSIEANLPQFTLEGVAYYASPVAGTGFKPLYRFFQTRIGAHFYTASETERQQVQSTMGNSHSYEGVGYHVFDTDCTLVNTTTQQAAANGCYLANHAEEVDITLPLSSALQVGDTLRVAGVGEGGWRISQNSAQRIQTTVPGAQVGAVWTARDANRAWKSVASSADGNKLVAAAHNDHLFLSSDAGLTWTPANETREWSSVASSTDGNKLVAVVDYGQIYTSSDTGHTWSARDTSRHWVSVASSADGTKLVALAQFDNHVYTSSDSGASWTASDFTSDADGNWASVASSADGQKLVAVQTTGFIYTSSNSGATWAQSGSRSDWTSVASSADGSKLIAVAAGAGVYLSSNSGADWLNLAWPYAWTAVAASTDGSKLIALSGEGYTFVSDDAGQSWNYRGSGNAWVAVASSADGNRLVALERDMQIRTSRAGTTPGTNSYLKGLATSYTELQYLGNDVFEMLESSGTVTVEIYDHCTSTRSAPKSGALRKC